MSRPPVICLKKEEPRSRYVRREVLSVFETFMNFRDPPQAGSVFCGRFCLFCAGPVFFVAVRSLVARRRCHPVAFQGFPSWAFVQIIGASRAEVVMGGV